MRRIHLVAAIAALIAGLAAAFTLTFPRTASAWSWNSLPNGYSVSVVNYTGSSGTCHQVTIDGHYMGDDCVDPTGLQTNVDAYIDSTICTVNPAAGQSAGMCQPTTTAATTTVAPATTTAATTTAAATTTDQTTTAAAAPVLPTSTSTSTTTDPVTTTVVVTTTVSDPALAARVTTLEQQYTALAARVDAIQQANAAAWQTYRADLLAGMDAPAAALDARSAALNAVYLLGP